MKSVKIVLKQTKGTQPRCSCQVHLFVSWWIVVVFVALSNFSSLLFHFSVLLFTQDVFISPLSLKEKKGEKSYTRQELISQAANSHSRWSVFFPSKMKGRNESSDLICAPQQRSTLEIVFSFRRFTLWISRLLFYFIYSSFDVSTSAACRLRWAQRRHTIKEPSVLCPVLDLFLRAQNTPVISAF